MIDERVVPGITDVGNVCKHIARYNLALPYCQGKNVADLACGNGYGSMILSLVAKQVIGVDIDRLSIKNAQKTYKFNNLRYSPSDILNVNFSPVDTIVSFETVEHINDLAKLEEKFNSLLNPSGLLFFSVPVNEPVGFNPYHFHSFDLSQARSLFPSLKLLKESIQVGVNFVNATETNQRYIYYLALRQKV
jgi:O-antigen biosynthesis protein